MIYRWTLSSLSLLLAFAAAACGPPPPIGSAVQSLAAGEIALPTPAWVIPSGAVLACGGVGISTVIHGDPADPRVAWLITDTGARIDAVWLAGYGARFVPTIEVLDAAGDVVLREGNPVTGGCPVAARRRTRTFSS